ncbi:hypothetical protein [Sphingobium lactosutens]|uniref:Uncharacterized protein n=1 Tax=Sphingobium lactosutens DS20 TaxID=1331060 RepID=T0IIW5_9SPHN|nr:hypothetical protein [Sphingobium lactosutens]EQB11670.1 hypothetical protein RLDS_21300 [Sphingobium lactosutens DS20]
MKKYAVAALAGFLMSSPALAVIDSNRTISRVGVQGSNSTAYVQFTVAPSAGCNYDTLYISLTTDAGRAIYSLLLTADASGNIINRVDYLISNGTCTINLIEI